MISGLAREIVIVDKNEKKAAGECMDLSHGLSFVQPASIYPGAYKDCANSDIVVITAGARQQPGQARLDLAQVNADMFKEMIPNITKHAKDAVILVVTNPVDILTYVSLKLSGLPSNRVIGSGTVLDSSRFRYLLSEHCNVDPRNVHAYIIGEHGDSELPVWSNANIGGMKIEKYCPTCKNFGHCDRKKELAAIFAEVKDAGYKIVDAKGSTCYGVAMALVKIAETILRDENSILPVSSFIKDYYGVGDICLSIPSLVNKNGVEKFLRLELSPQEQLRFKRSAEALKKVIKSIKF
jgi:L-lactate dehydrogenase